MGENGRLMPAPSGGQVVNWVPQTPSLKFAAGLDQKLAAAVGKAKAFAIDFNVDYDYGADGYNDVEFSVSVGSSFRSIITSAKVTGSSDKAERKLEFSLNHPTSAKKEAVYYIDVTVVSKKYKLLTKQRFNIHFTAVKGLGAGGMEDAFTQGGMAAMRKKIGGKDRLYTLCYSTARDGGWISTKLQAQCAGEHDLLWVQKRGRKGYTTRVFGGYFGAKKYSLGAYYGTGRSGYLRGNDRSKHSWIWRTNPGNKNQLQYANPTRGYYVYKSTSYFMQFGYGPDYRCIMSSGDCQTNLGRSYTGYGRTWQSGTYRWNGKNEKDTIDVYITNE